MCKDYAERPERLWLVGMPSDELEQDAEAWREAKTVLNALADAVGAMGNNDAPFVALIDAALRCRKHADRLEAESRKPEVEYPTVFAKVLSGLAGYLGEDMDRLAGDLVSGMGGLHGDREREALAARLGSPAAPAPSVEFMERLAVHLGLEGGEREELAVALGFEA